MTAVPAAATPSDQQRRAIEAPLGPVLVLAGPGAGKTFCLIERIRFLIERLGADPGRICAVTFTNKAAEEIAARLHREIGSAGDAVIRGTLHALCLDLLRVHGERVGLRRGFGVADEEYQRITLRRLGVASKRIGGLLTLFGRRRLQDFRLTGGDQDLLDRYQATLRTRNVVDFDDLIALTRDLLSRHHGVEAELAGRWDHLLVDEFQDLSPAQYEIVRRLAGTHRSVFAVGDDEQSIFSWTGADPAVLHHFRADFGIDQPIMLDHNRRSTRAIFAAARRLVEHNPRLFDKRLEAVRESPFAVVAQAFPDEQLEALWVLGDLVADRTAHGGSWGDYAVLYRKHEVGELLERLMVEAGIPCRLARGRALLDDEVIGQVVASLRIVRAPDDPVAILALAERVLPRDLLERLQLGEAEDRVLETVRAFAQRGHRDDPDTKKAWRFVFHVENLTALAGRHPTLAGLVEELLTQRIGPYRSPLEDRSDELSDPARYPGASELADLLERAAADDGRVLVAPAHGLEIALRGMLVRTARVRAVSYLQPDTAPEPGDVVLRPDAAAPAELGMRLFKALQLTQAREFADLPRDFVAFDLETSDFDRAACEIIEIGAARVLGGLIVETFHTLVRCGRPVADAATRVHGYRDADLDGQPTLEDVWPRFRAFVGGHLLVAHNAHGFDVPVLRRVAAGLPGLEDLRFFDTLPLARALFAESARLEDLAHRFGVSTGRAHHAVDDAVTLAHVMGHLGDYKLARSRKAALVNLLDLLGLALVLGEDPDPTPERRLLKGLARPYVLGRYGDALEFYAAERERTPAPDAPTAGEVIEKFGGRKELERYRAERTPAERYPGAVARLAGLVAVGGSGTLDESIARMLERVALSTSEGAETDPARVNLLTLHSTKGLEFSRVYIVGVEDYQLPGYYAAVENRLHEIEESRRLLYVGMTRAMDRLVLTRAETRFGKPAGGSLFLEEMGLTT